MRSLVLVRHAGGLLLFAFTAACVQPRPADLPMVPGVRVDVAVQQDPVGPGRRFIRVKAKLTNQGPDLARFTVGGCALVIRAYATETPEQGPVWSSAQVRHPCPDVLRRFQLTPRDSAVLEDAFSTDVVSSTGFNPGRYVFSVSIRFLEPPRESPEYPAGSLTIAR